MLAEALAMGPGANGRGTHHLKDEGHGATDPHGFAETKLEILQSRGGRERKREREARGSKQLT